jgi:uncharacterized protein (UPF0548 family)
MFTFQRPTDDDVRAVLAHQHDQPWSYEWPGVTRTDPAQRRGWQIDRHRVLLGRGREIYAAACEALRQWKMFPREMCQVFWPDCPQQPGQVVAVLYRAQALGLWMLFPARVVYAVGSPTFHVGQVLPSTSSDAPAHTECGPTCGFAYGTLPDHPERGEERFLIEWNAADDTVWYDLLAISRPGHWLARVGYPYARYEQAKFRRLSGLAMQAAVASVDTGGAGV